MYKTTCKLIPLIKQTVFSGIFQLILGVPVSFSSRVDVEEDNEYTCEEHQKARCFNKLVHVCQVFSSKSPIDNNNQANDVSYLLF